MKGIFLFCTKLKYYFIELPLMIMLTVAIHYNGNYTGLFKFYPLIVLLSLGIIFIAVYFFRGIYISSDEIRDIGIFSRRERELIKKDGILVITLRGRGKMNIDLWAYSEEPAFDWMKNKGDYTKNVRVYHGVCIAGKSRAVRILSLFGLDGNLSREFTERDGARFDNQKILVTTEKKHDTFEIRIKFLETVI